MRKKIILLGVGLAVSVSGFAVYAYVTGASLFGGARHTAEPEKRHPQLEEEADIASPSFETRDADMRLEYVLSAKSAHPLGKGQHIFDLVEPRITYYTKDGNLIVVTADAGQVAVDVTGGDESKMQPKGGRLSKNVCLTEGPQDSFEAGTTERQPRQMQARFGSDIDFSYADRTLESKGTIQVRGDRISFDGENLTLLYNSDQRRIEYLRIDRGDRIVIKDALGGREGGGGPFSGVGRQGEAGNAGNTGSTGNLAAGTAGGGGQTPGAAKSAGSGGGASSGGGSNTAARAAEAKPADAPTLYRLVFDQEVKAVLGARTLTSDDMALIFQGSASEVEDKSAAKPAAAPGPAAALPGPLAEMTSPAGAAPATPAAPAAPAAEDLILTWHGPMEMRPMADGAVKLNNSKDNIFEAASHQGRPVLITEGDSRVVRAGHVWYHTDTAHLHLDPAELGQVELTDAAMGHLVCRGVDYSEGNGALEIAGPAQMEAKAGALQDAGGGLEAGVAPAVDAGTNKQPVVAKWTQMADLTLVKVADAKDPKKTTQVVRRAIIHGDADVRDPTFWIHADTLDALVAHVDSVPQDGAGEAKAPKTRQGLEHLLATGGVQAQSYHGGAASPESPDQVQGDRLELSTTPSPDTKLPEPSRLQVDGHVFALTHQPDKKDPKHVLQDQIMAPHLVVTLEPKGKTGDAAGADHGAHDVIGGVTAKELDATGGAEVKLEGYDKEPVIASADALHADQKAGTATLHGLAANGDVAGRLARLTLGEDHLTGMTLQLDQKAETVDIPGAGEFAFLMPARASDTKKEDTPVLISWQAGMHYDNKNLFADFAGPVHAQLLGKPDQDSELTSDNMHVRMARAMAASAGQPAAGGAGDAGEFGGVRPAEIRAIGHVRADGATYDAQREYLTRMLLTDVDLLVYSEETKMLVIPGKGQMLLEDRRPEAPTTQPARGGGIGGGDTSSARGKTAFAWDGSLSYAGDTGLIHMKKDVKMHHVPLKPIRLDTHAGAAKPGDKPADKADANRLPPIENIYLDCDDMVATVVSPKNASSNPVALGANEGAHLTKMVAQGTASERAVLDMSPVELAAEVLEYDAVANKAIATSRAGSRIPAHAESPEWGMLNAEQIIWDMTKDPAKKDEAITLIRPRLSSTQ